MNETSLEGNGPDLEVRESDSIPEIAPSEQALKDVRSAAESGLHAGPLPKHWYGE